jgi:hypothetical protein
MIFVYASIIRTIHLLIIINIIGKDYTFYECFILHLSCLQGYLFLMFSHS